MKKAIVTTTINPPTQAIKKYIQIAQTLDYHIFIIGDKKTPEPSYRMLEQDFDCVTYLSPVEQELKYKKLSDRIGWNCIQRRNIGFVEAYRWGADLIATIDDDNIPFENWGIGIDDISLDTVEEYTTTELVFDPLSVTNYPDLWHRGYPIQDLLKKQRITKNKSSSITILGQRSISTFPLVVADLWNGEPDVDAVCRIAKGPFDCNFTLENVFTSDKPMPFNSQNTHITRRAMPQYFMFPHIGRMDDIWAAYFMQAVHGTGTVAFRPPTVYQERNEHDLSKDLAAEMIGYSKTKAFVTELFHSDKNPYDVLAEFLPTQSYKAFVEYQKLLGES